MSIYSHPAKSVGVPSAPTVGLNKMGQCPEKVFCWWLVAPRGNSRFKNNYCAEMCSGSEEGLYVRRMDFLSLNSRLKSNKEEEEDVSRHDRRGGAWGEGAEVWGRSVVSSILRLHVELELRSHVNIESKFTCERNIEDTTGVIKSSQIWWCAGV